MTTHPLVLIAEDDRDIRDLLSYTFEKAGFRTVTADDGRSAAEILIHDHPAAIIADVRMPNLTGTDLCQLVRRDPRLRDIAIVLLSANIQPEDITEGMTAGADRYFTKPTSLHHLVEEVEEVLTRHLHDR
ncbi:response regulator [Actinoplanes sp. NPDC051851]|uniref:response regulator n=1 Tax=Actinoplanes sp. NPDC051851 TaxID=3154753 RepID=UPI0034159F41